MRYAFTVPNVERGGEEGVLFGPASTDPRIARMDVDFDPTLRQVYLEQIELLARVLVGQLLTYPATSVPEDIVGQTNLLLGALESFDEFLDRTVKEHDARHEG